MDTSYLIFTQTDSLIKIEKFHNLTWEFDTNSSLVEFGFEISQESLQDLENLDLLMYIPWTKQDDVFLDLYDKLKDFENSKFIFNDTVANTKPLDAGKGVVHNFKDRKVDLCFLPIKIENLSDNVVKLSVNLKPFNSYTASNKNLYVRFSIKPSISSISIKKNGISKSVFIYDTKFNVSRNIPQSIIDKYRDIQLCKIDNCFCFNILPNNFDIVFLDSNSLQSVRTLEYESFQNYIGDKRIQKDELMVVFNKKKSGESYSFFSIYSKEHMGIAQFSMAILLNILCGILFFIASFRSTPIPGKNFFEALILLPGEIYFAFIILLITIWYFVAPKFNEN